MWEKNLAVQQTCCKINIFVKLNLKGERYIGEKTFRCWLLMLRIDF